LCTVVSLVYPGLLTPAFITCSTASDKRWGKKAWVQGYTFVCGTILSGFCLASYIHPKISFILECAVPGIVASLSATPVNSTALTLRWQPPPPEDRNGVITQYVVNITGLSVAGQEPFVLHTTETSIVVGLLHPSYTYACEVAAVTSVGQGPYRSITSQLPEDGMHIYFAIYNKNICSY